MRTVLLHISHCYYIVITYYLVTLAYSLLFHCNYIFTTNYCKPTILFHYKLLLCIIASLLHHHYECLSYIVESLFPLLHPYCLCHFFITKMTSTTTHYYIFSLADEGWYRLSAVLNFGVFNKPKRIQTPHSLFWDFWADKTSRTRWSGGRVQVWVQVRAPAGQWQSLPNAIPEDSRRFWLQNQWLSSLGHALAQLGRVGRARSNTGRFWVGDSHCWQRQARLRKTCYHSCDTDSVHESKKF